MKPVRPRRRKHRKRRSLTTKEKVALGTGALIATVAIASVGYYVSQRETDLKDGDILTFVPPLSKPAEKPYDSRPGDEHRWRALEDLADTGAPTKKGQWELFMLPGGLEAVPGDGKPATAEFFVNNEKNARTFSIGNNLASDNWNPTKDDIKSCIFIRHGWSCANSAMNKATISNVVSSLKQKMFVTPYLEYAGALQACSRSNVVRDINTLDNVSDFENPRWFCSSMARAMETALLMSKDSEPERITVLDMVNEEKNWYDGWRKGLTSQNLTNSSACHCDSGVLNLKFRDFTRTRISPENSCKTPRSNYPEFVEHLSRLHDRNIVVVSHGGFIKHNLHLGSKHENTRATLVEYRKCRYSNETKTFQFENESTGDPGAREMAVEAIEKER